MPDMGIWALSAIASPAATDRLPLESASGVGGHSPRSSFVWGNASSQYTCAGSLGVNVTSSVRLHVKDATAEIFRLETTNARGAGNLYQAWYDASGRKGYFGFPGANDTMSWMNELNAAMQFGTNSTFRMVIEAGGTIRPATDNSQNLAAASFRFNNSYFGVAPTVSSDARLKQVRGDGQPTPEEIAWAQAIRPTCYQLIAAIAEKGDGARLHWGVLAQQVHQAGLDAGIEDPFHYAFLGRDRRMTTETRRIKVLRHKHREVSATEPAIELRDGRAVQVLRTVKRMEPEFRDLPVYDESGALIMADELMTDGAGNVLLVEGKDGPAPVMRSVPVMHRDPVMEEVEIDEEYQVPAVDADGEPDYLWSIRYEELLLFAWACGALGAAPEPFHQAEE